jgi:hypothetical protein
MPYPVVAMRHAKEYAMKYESLSFQGNGDKSRVSIKGDALWPSRL